MLLRVALCASLLVFPACSDQGQDAELGTTGDAAAVTAEAGQVPASAAADEAMIFRTFRSPSEFPLPFSTSVPQGVEAEPVSSGEGEAIRFVANSDGTRRDAAHVHFFVYRPEATEDAARETIRSIAEAFGPIRPGDEVEPISRHPWALAEFELQGGGTGQTMGFVALGRHTGRLFHIAVQYPAEYADQFAPRAQHILDEWRWEDTGEPLSAGR